jgi:hypothetical protein
MATLEDIIKLSEIDGGKFFVMDEKGDAKLVIMSVEAYQQMLTGKLYKQVEDIEKINRQITEAQLREDREEALDKREQRLERREERANPISQIHVPRVDMREEVIDPSFNFDSPVDENIEV